MSSSQNWQLCFEVGLNHLGKFELVEQILNELYEKKLQCAVSIQIREESFYLDGRESFQLSIDEYLKIGEMCATFNLPFGIALGPLQDKSWLLECGLEPDFLKILGMATKDISFIDSLGDFTCEKYYSVGLCDLNFIESEVVPRMRNNDALIHTSMSHNFRDQNLLEIHALKSMGCEVFFGQHSVNEEVCFAAIGMGASKIFVYVGDKGLDLPDYEHAIPIADTKKFHDQCLICFEALGSTENKIKKSKIEFIG